MRIRSKNLGEVSFMDALNAKDDVESVVSRYRNFVKGQKMINTRIALVQEGL